MIIHDNDDTRAHEPLSAAAPRRSPATSSFAETVGSPLYRRRWPHFSHRTTPPTSMMPSARRAMRRRKSAAALTYLAACLAGRRRRRDEDEATTPRTKSSRSVGGDDVLIGCLTAVSVPRRQFQDPRSHPAPPGDAGAGRSKEEAAATRRRAVTTYLSLAGPFTRVDAQHRARRRHQPHDHHRAQDRYAAAEGRGGKDRELGGPEGMGIQSCAPPARRAPSPRSSRLSNI